MGVTHWDDVESFHPAKGELDATWQQLGDAAGSRGVGVHRVRVAPGRLSTPPHSHSAIEEIFFVLDGSGLAWQDEEVYELGARDCVVHTADHFEHTFKAGPDGLEYLAFSTRERTEYGWLPRSRAARLGYVWVEGRTDDPWEIEAQQQALHFGEPSARPANIVALADAPPLDHYRRIGEAAGAEQAGLNWLRLAEGELGAPPHCHSADEELFVVLAGQGTLELWPTPVAAGQGHEREDVPVRAGSVVSRLPSSKIAHTFRGGPGGLTLLLFGTNRPNDVCYYPRSNKIYWRGLGLIGRIEALEYADGEPPD